MQAIKQGAKEALALVVVLLFVPAVLAYYVGSMILAVWIATRITSDPTSGLLVAGTLWFVAGISVAHWIMDWMKKH